MNVNEILLKTGNGAGGREGDEAIRGKTTMRALLINPKQRTITEIDYDGTPEAMGKLIGCDIFKVASTLNGWLQEGSDAVWVSGDGPDDDKYPSQWFQIGVGTDRATDPIPGKGLVVGIDKAGENCPAIISDAELTRRRSRSANSAASRAR